MLGLRNVVPLSVAVLALSAHAAIFDSFSRTGPLAGTSPDTGGGAYVGSVTEFNTDGTKLNVASAAGEHGTMGLPISVPTGTVVTASVDLIVDSSTDFNWLALGFMSSTPSDAMYNLGGPWAFVRGLGEVQALSGSGSSSSEFDNHLTGVPGATTHVELDLDTRNPNWVASFYLNGQFDGQFTYTTNPTITYVGLGHDLASGSFDNFSVSINAVPEPSTVALLLVPAAAVLIKRNNLRRLGRA